MRRTLRTYAATAFVVALILVGLVPPAPSLATHGVDLVHAAPTGWVSTAGGVTCPVTGRSCDANDSTGERHDGHCGSQDVGRGTHNYCTGYVQFTRSSGVTTFDLSSMRLLAKTCQTGDGSTCGGATLDMTSVVVQELISGTCSGTAPELGYASQSASATFETGEIEIDTVTIANNEGICFFVEVVAMNTVQWFTVSSIELFGEGLSIASDFLEYVYDLRLDHPPFARVISWAWLKTWDGTWSVEDSDDTLLAGGISGATEHARESVSISCFPVCGADTYTIHIHEDGHDAVSYDISSTLNGQLVLDAGHAFISFIEGCYNVTLNSCDDATYDAAADALSLSFTLVPEGGAEHPDRHYDGTVTIGRWDRSSGFDCAFVGSTVTTGSLALGAHGPQVITAWDETAGFFDANGDQLVLLMWTSDVDDLRTCATAAIPITGGDTGTTNPPVPGSGPAVNAPCADLVSCIGREFRAALEGLMGAAEDVWSDAIGVAHDAMLEKLPFAYIVLAFDGIGAQISRAAVEVESSDDCSGITLAVPLYYGTSPLTPTPTTLPITVLTCAQLEPFMGTEWYQAIRTALDPALWLLFAWAKVRELQPKTSLNG